MAAIEPDIIDLTGLSDSSEEEEGDRDEEDEDELGDEDESGDEDGSESSTADEHIGDASESSTTDEHIQVPVDNSTRAQLREVIASVNEERLRQVLTRLVDTVPAVENALLRELVTLKRKSQSVISRWEICSNCEEEFDMETEREEEECSFHPGASDFVQIVS
ncbi:hypothetical protein DXG03_008040 [Asterophora parasitica]|uniref:Uncharacterized protein n=1 Tax=Asterophora parasitica TaxID=117018 RepID=A0A9P7G9I5_9AGAR|nr:hypothetical protein DXG03_008040 [Asterophora parasitica]